jgi:hypothetical protein
MIKYLIHRAVPLFLVIGLLTWIPTSVLTDVAEIGLKLTVVTVLLVGVARHGGRLCSRCVDAMSLNGPETAARRRMLLHAAHHAMRLLGIAFVCLVASAFMDADNPIGNLLNSTGYAVMALEIFTAAEHDRLQPWCPFCCHGHGGDDEDEPVPTPPDRLVSH